jgi:predicted signal transduction protein with EAL and GGDEF domain
LEGAQFELGASVGVALFPADGNDEDALMRRADAALYRAKSLGKRRVELANDPDAGRPSDPVAEAEALCLARPRS